MPRKVRIIQRQCPGDIIVLTAALKALHQSQPGLFITDFHGHHRSIFDNNPYITPLEPWEGQEVQGDYGYHISGMMTPHGPRGGCGRPYHFIHSFADHFSKVLGVYIELQDFHGNIYLSNEEKMPWPGLPEKYIYLNASHKNDYTAKYWSDVRFQEVVDALKDRVTFVQVGSAADYYAKLNNVINLVGQTDLRQSFRIMYRASLVLTAVSYPMHASAAIPLPNGEIRPCVVLAGQREQRAWEEYPGHLMMGTEGKLPCVENGKACWVNKVTKVDRDNSVCRFTVNVGNKPVPGCLERISTKDVVEAIERYLGI